MTDTTQIEITVKINVAAVVRDQDILNYLHHSNVPDSIKLTRTNVRAWIETLEEEIAERNGFIAECNNYDYDQADDPERERRTAEIDIEMTTQEIGSRSRLLTKFQEVMGKLDKASTSAAKSIAPCPQCETPQACKEHGCGLLDHPGNDIQFQPMGGA